ncbi:sensor histidine kinase [Aerosakkonemataceae cyanobacterium BLCC-F154]|uniref:histidine kinase n=1 Tax=Floridaenema fluviatile BLCC-F154 TaxID=3153640 RepID=A0ABV4YLQ3_9CYAN
MKIYDYQNMSEMMNPSEVPIERLFSLLNHELRTPIASLQTALDLLQMYQQCDRSEAQALLNLAVDNADRLTQTIENILDWYDLVHKANAIFKQPLDGAALIQRVVSKVQLIATQQRIQINLDIPNFIPLTADDYYLSRALSYLLHNAIKFSPSDRQVWLTATIIQTGETSDLPTLPYLLITIKDEGVGIPETSLPQIFQPFEQVDSSDTRRYGGLGLELAICDRIIQEHRGKIWAESTLGEGSTFYVALPLS